MVLLLPEPVVTAVIRVVAVENHPVFAGRSLELVVHKRLWGVKIENKQPPLPLKSDNFVFGMLVKKDQIQIIEKPVSFESAIMSRSKRSRYAYFSLGSSA